MSAAADARPIREQLTRLLMLASVLTALVVLAGVSIFEFVGYRQAMRERIDTLAEVIAANSTAALAFDNADDAVGVLRALEADRAVRAAVLYAGDGRPFAAYPATALTNAPAPPAQGAQGFRFSGGTLAGFERVRHDGRDLGSLYLEADVSALYARLLLFAGVALLMIGVSIPAVYAVSRRLQLRISKPILALTDTARAVSARHDYSVRAPAASGFELVQLTSAFNHMLATTEEAQDKIEVQLSRLNLLHHITRAIGERQDLPSILQALLGALEDNLPMDLACACVYDASGPRLTVTKIGGRTRPLALALGLVEGTELPIDANGLSTCLGGQLVYEPDTRVLDFPFPQRLAAGGLFSLVAAPMVAESRVFGVILCARRAAEAFLSADCEFLRHLSEHVALASHQAQLYADLQQAYDDLRQTQHSVMQQERLRALGQMASGIAHDINNAISPVALYTESLLEREPNLSERTRTYLVTIQRAIEDVAETVARMREFYRPRETLLQLGRVSLNDLVEQVVHLTKARWSDLPQQRGLNIELRTELDPALPEIMGAENEIRDALTNLIFNALDAMPEGGQLTLRTRAVTVADGSRQVQVLVEDTGIGMDEETRRRCLEPFYTTKGERGTGLGLAMVYGMVQRHSAELNIDSTLGKGTSFVLGFAPATAGADASAQSPEDGSRPQRALRILLVDDDPVLIKALSEILERDGHHVTIAHGGQAGVETLQQGVRFDVVFTDLGMPQVDGRKVAAASKAAQPQAPVIMLTGWGKRLLAENEIPPHVDRVLSKPPRLAELRAALDDLTTHRTAVA